MNLEGGIKMNDKKLGNFLWFVVVVLTLMLVLQILSYSKISDSVFSDVRLSPTTAGTTVGGTVTSSATGLSLGDGYIGVVYVDVNGDGKSDYSLYLNCPPTNIDICNQKYVDGSTVSLSNLKLINGSNYAYESTADTVKTVSAGTENKKVNIMGVWEPMESGEFDGQPDEPFTGGQGTLQ
ncbi:MAG: hypothetical protein NUV97_03650 [archaeon]|nr:hypothetical protein [archaeon]MCR4323888.1 hypothetical protein [Nanoarchaeota archaeon]